MTKLLSNSRSNKFLLHNKSYEKSMILHSWLFGIILLCFLLFNRYNLLGWQWDHSPRASCIACNIHWKLLSCSFVAKKYHVSKIAHKYMPDQIFMMTYNIAEYLWVELVCTVGPSNLMLWVGCFCKQPTPHLTKKVFSKEIVTRKLVCEKISHSYSILLLTLIWADNDLD